jgi:membrane protein DedA with SNARE-associated domain
MDGLLVTCLLLKTLPESAWRWIHGLGGPGLILLGILDNSPVMSTPPGTIDIVVITLATDHNGWWPYYAIMAVIGELIGGYLTYDLAKESGKATLEKKIGKARAEKNLRPFRKARNRDGAGRAVLPPPFPYTSILIAAGVMQYPKKKFLSALATGRLVRFFGEAALGRIYGGQIVDIVAAHYHFMEKLLIILGIGMIIGAVAYFAWYRPKSKRENQVQGSEIAPARNAPEHVTR